MLSTALDAAQAAGAILSRYFETTDYEREVKDDASFVTKADKEAEAAVVSLIRANHPEHGILGEEGGSANPDSEYQWIIDPLDGTSNFINGIPIFAVSIALVHNQVPIIGVVYNPITRSLSVAEQGKGTTYNGKPVCVSDKTPDDGMVTFGMSKDERIRTRKLFANTDQHIKSARVLGSAACELSFVSRGGTEAFVSLGLKPWDYAAGALLVLEAGGTVTTYDGKPWNMSETYFIASNGPCHEVVRALVQSVPS